VGRLFADEDARAKTVSDIAKAAKVDPDHVYLDVPTTPSIPYTYSKEALRFVGLLRVEGNRRIIEAMPLKKLPLVGSIAGFMDVLRVYTTAESRSAVQKVASQFFRDQNFVARVTS